MNICDHTRGRLTIQCAGIHGNCVSSDLPSGWQILPFSGTKKISLREKIRNTRQYTSGFHVPEIGPLSLTWNVSLPPRACMARAAGRWRDPRNSDKTEPSHSGYFRMSFFPSCVRFLSILTTMFELFHGKTCGLFGGQADNVLFHDTT